MTLFLLPTVLAPKTEKEVLAPHVLETIKELDCFLVENIRSARRFISSLRLGKVIEDLQFEVVDKKTKPEVIDKIFKKFKGKDIGVLSEAGCPGVADPGALAVAYAHRKEIKVVPLVGPSSILLSLMASGMNGQSFAFHGYLPIDKKDRVLKIKELEKNLYHKNQTQLFIETPFRNNQLLKDLLENCHNNTLLCVACDVTSEDEFIETRPVHEWKQKKGLDFHKRPTIFLLGN
ncbi:MAG: SAM-dependent methyltransferase [Cytophagales bacterium]|nr:SAM-dependent methyltransferase [Cytophagales bacterium]